MGNKYEKLEMKDSDKYTKIREGLSCIICEKSVKQMEDFNLDEASDGWVKCWYGSGFDLMKFDLVICDKCVKEKSDKGIIKLEDFDL